jgi:hypothetical protein
MFAKSDLDALEGSQKEPRAAEEGADQLFGRRPTPNPTDRSSRTLLLLPLPRPAKGKRRAEAHQSVVKAMDCVGGIGAHIQRYARRAMLRCCWQAELIAKLDLRLPPSTLTVMG